MMETRKRADVRWALKAVQRHEDTEEVSILMKTTGQASWPVHEEKRKRYGCSHSGSQVWSRNLWGSENSVRSRLRQTFNMMLFAFSLPFACNRQWSLPEAMWLITL